MPPAVTTYPATTSAAALVVLAHGAGAGQKHPFMVATARELSARGFDVVTFDFAYMAAGRHVPDRTPVLEQAFREAIAEARRWSPAGRLIIGGKSMGGRMATHLGAQGVDGLAGIVALGYPLHPPGKPDQPRVAHLPAIGVPVLIVQGERDPFGTPRELEPVVRTMTAQVTLHVVSGGDHSLAVRRRTAPEIYDVIANWMRTVAGRASAVSRL
jgi:predicted alpha/beta-hydrolase family hydrolase